ncbi:MAG: hypothetical protein FWC34_06200 [Bacteroidetes bacterium]|nr:hypothetical protein [Bacteroidota bacterium]MCL2302983.1 hypothetical protein [Lentimicrobiaceae bacterium]
MMYIRKLILNFKFLILNCLLLCNSALSAQEFSGYVSGMPSIIVQHPGSEVWWQMLVHNRLNFGSQMGKYLRVDVGVRNRIIAGSEMLIDPKSISHDLGWLNLSWNWKEWKNVVGNTSFDRLSLTFEKNKWKLRLGRQRINWGQTFVWNPNDIFNTYSFFDFDYIERPGCDAFRGTYYHSATSSSELAVSVNRDNKVTAAYLFRRNWKSIDYQLIGGMQTESDLVIGGAITSDIKGLNLRGEMSYFHPFKSFVDTSGIVALSIGTDYVFSNSLMLQAEFLYNNVNKTFSEGGLIGLYSAPLSAKYLSICNWNLFAQVSYPFTPLFKGSLSSMYFIDIQSFYVGMSLDYSIIENLDLSFITQYFASFSNSNPGNMHALLGFVRIKYAF